MAGRTQEDKEWDGEGVASSESSNVACGVATAQAAEAGVEAGSASAHVQARVECNLAVLRVRISPCVLLRARVDLLNAPHAKNAVSHSVPYFAVHHGVCWL